MFKQGSSILRSNAASSSSSTPSTSDTSTSSDSSSSTSTPTPSNSSQPEYPATHPTPPQVTFTDPTPNSSPSQPRLSHQDDIGTKDHKNNEVAATATQPDAEHHNDNDQKQPQQQQQQQQGHHWGIPHFHRRPNHQASEIDLRSNTDHSSLSSTQPHHDHLNHDPSGHHELHDRHVDVATLLRGNANHALRQSAASSMATSTSTSRPRGHRKMPSLGGSIIAAASGAGRKVKGFVWHDGVGELHQSDKGKEKDDDGKQKPGDDEHPAVESGGTSDKEKEKEKEKARLKSSSKDRRKLPFVTAQSMFNLHSPETERRDTAPPQAVGDNSSPKTRNRGYALLDSRKITIDDEHKKVVNVGKGDEEEEEEEEIDKDAVPQQHEFEYNPFEAMNFPPKRIYGSFRSDTAEDDSLASILAMSGAAGASLIAVVRSAANEVESLISDVEQRNTSKKIAKDIVEGKLLHNFRDLHLAATKRSTAKLAKQKIYRSACISRGDVLPSEVATTCIYLRDVVGIRTIIDFRNKDEKETDPCDEIVAHVYPSAVAYFPPKQRGTPEPTRRADEEPETCRRFHIPLMNSSMKLKGLFLPSKSSTKWHMVQAVFTERTMVEVFSEEAMNPLGLLGLNKLMLIYSKNEILSVLRICANAANYPIMYHCSSGKDRTGLITALILLCCAVDIEDIVENYHQSEILLTIVMKRIQDENIAKGLIGFDGTPAEVMRDTIAFLFEKWGSVTGYFEYIGFTPGEQMQLVSSLTITRKKQQKKD